MSTKNFVEGETYFRLSFLDRAMTRPVVDTLVFIGMNLSDDDSEETWYFQDAHSYNASGPAHDTGGQDAEVFCNTNEELGDLFDLAGLVSELGSVASRHAKR